MIFSALLVFAVTRRHRLLTFNYVKNKHAKLCVRVCGLLPFHNVFLRYSPYLTFFFPLESSLAC